MDGETNGGQEATQGAESTSQQQGQSQVSGDATDNEKIASLEARLPNAGVASDEGKTLEHWREIAGLTDDDDKQ